MNENKPQLELPLSTLNLNGLSEFRMLIGAAPGLYIADVQERIRNIAAGKETATVVNKSVMVPFFPPLVTRHDTALLVSDLLSKAGIEAGPSSGHDELFSWLALIFFPSLCGRTTAGTIDAKQRHRYLVSRSTSDFYRHLVACPYWLLKQYGKFARIFLSQDAHVMPDVVEQIVSRPALIDSKGVVQVIDQLYWDEAVNRPKAGFTTTKRHKDEPPPGFAKSSPAPGTLRALEWTLGQLQCTHDLRSMSAEQIMAKLPSEFDHWKEKVPA